MRKVLAILLVLNTFILSAKFNDKDVFGTRGFIENKGQFNLSLNTSDKILYAYIHESHKVFFTESGPVYKFIKEFPLNEWQREKLEKGQAPKEKPSLNYFVKVKWLNANQNISVVSDDKQSYYLSYGAADMKSNVYKKITYKNVYNNIDIEYLIPEDKALGIKYNVIVHPGGDVSQVKIAYEGDVDKLKLKDNEIIIKTALDDLKEYSPVSFSNGNKIATNFVLTDNVISFNILGSYDANSDLVIDPWVMNISSLTSNNYGFDVDYDYAGNTYVFGGSGPYMIAKYSSAGALLWTFAGTVAVPAWTSLGDYPSSKYMGNFVVNKFTGQCYTGHGFCSAGAQIIRIDVNGVYNNFITPAQSSWKEAWEMGFHCGTGNVFGLGGSTTSNQSAGIVNQTNASINPIPLTTNAAIAQDVACFTNDEQGNAFIIYASYSAPFNNLIGRINAPFTNTVWAQNSTYNVMTESANKGAYVGTGLPSTAANAFNCLAVNGNYLYYYDGLNLAAYNKTTGAKIGFTTIPAYTLKAQGGIAVDDCDNLYLGGNNGTILCYKFNGTTFTALAPINLGVTTPNKYVYDIKYDKNTNLLHACGSGFIGTWSAVNSLTCTVNQYSVTTVCAGNNNGTAITTVTTNIANPVYSFTYVTSTQTVATFSNIAIPSNTATNLANGNYTVFIQINAPCGPINTQTFNINCVCSVTAAASTSCTPTGNSFTLSVAGTSGFIGTPSYTWSGPGSFSSNQQNPIFTNGNYGTYTLVASTAGCSSSSTVNALVVSSFTPVLTNTAVLCYNGATGAASVSAITGTSTAPYTYTWTGNPMQTAVTATALTAGNYTCYVTDSKGCTYSATTSISQPPAVSLTINTTTTQICAGSPIVMTANATGGSGSSYTYSWTNGVTSASNSVSQINGGVYTYTVNAFDGNMCPISGVQSLTFIPTPTITVDNKEICYGKQTILNANGANAYTWTPSNSLSNNVGNSVTSSPSVTTIYSIFGANAFCSNTATVEVKVVPIPDLVLSTPNNKICQGNSTTIYASGATNYSWSPANTLSSATSPNAVANPTASTNYTITGYNMAGTVSCAATQEILIQVVPQVTPSISSNATICAGQTVKLNASGGNTYVWTPTVGLNNGFIASPYAGPKATTVYSVHVSIDGFCGHDATVAVNVNPTPSVNAGEDKTYNLDEDMVINAVGNGTLTWIFGQEIYCKDCPKTQIFPKTSGCYIVEAVNEYKCKSTDEVCIEVTANHNIYIPNTFTPNDDNLNDIFLVYGTGITKFEMSIFDRWGQKLFGSKDQLKGWDGYFKNELCKADVYVYVVTYTALDGKSYTKTGHVTLMK